MKGKFRKVSPDQCFVNIPSIKEEKSKSLPDCEDGVVLVGCAADDD